MKGTTLLCSIALLLSALFVDSTLGQACPDFAPVDANTIATLGSSSFERIQLSYECDGLSRNNNNTYTKPSALNVQISNQAATGDPLRIAMQPPGLLEPFVADNTLKFRVTNVMQTQQEVGLEINLPKGNAVKHIDIVRDFVKVNVKFLEDVTVVASGGYNSVFLDSSGSVSLTMTNVAGQAQIRAPVIQVTQSGSGGTLEIKGESNDSSSITGQQTGGPNNVAIVEGRITSWKAKGPSNKLTASSCANFDAMGSDSTCEEQTDVQVAVTGVGGCLALAGAEVWECPDEVGEGTSGSSNMGVQLIVSTLLSLTASSAYLL